MTAASRCSRPRRGLAARLRRGRCLGAPAHRAGGLVPHLLEDPLLLAPLGRGLGLVDGARLPPGLRRAARGRAVEAATARALVAGAAGHRCRPTTLGAAPPAVSPGAVAAVGGIVADRAGAAARHPAPAVGPGDAGLGTGIGRRAPAPRPGLVARARRTTRGGAPGVAATRRGPTWAVVTTAVAIGTACRARRAAAGGRAARLAAPGATPAGGRAATRSTRSAATPGGAARARARGPAAGAACAAAAGAARAGRATTAGAPSAGARTGTSRTAWGCGHRGTSVHGCVRAPDGPGPGRKREETPAEAGASPEKSGGVLLSRGVSSQVPSALVGLTSVFGMGTGVTPRLWPPKSVVKEERADRAHTL